MAQKEQIGRTGRENRFPKNDLSEISYRTAEGTHGDYLTACGSVARNGVIDLKRGVRHHSSLVAYGFVVAADPRHCRDNNAVTELYQGTQGHGIRDACVGVCLPSNNGSHKSS
jgi:hypothetical protein